MTLEVAAADIHGAGVVVREGASIRGAWDVAADGGVLRLGMADADGSARVDEAEEFWRDVFVQAKAAVGAWVGLLPAGVEAVAGLEFDPVGHGSSGEFPACGLATDFYLFESAGAIVGPAVTVGTAGGVFVVGAEVSGRCCGARFSDADRSDQERL